MSATTASVNTVAAAARSVLCGRRRPQWAAIIIVAAVLGTGLWFLRWSGGNSRATPDTFWYARDSFHYAGYPARDADAMAAQLTCQNYQRARPALSYASCLRYRHRLPRVAPIRFQHIFTARPGYALATVPFVWVFGGAGFAIGSAVLGVACGVAMVLLALAAGLRLTHAFVAETLFYLLPTGLWASRMLAEAPMMLCLIGALTGAVLLLGGRVRGAAGPARTRVARPVVPARTGTAPTGTAPTVGAPTVGAPTVGAPTVGAPTVGAPTVGTPTGTPRSVTSRTVSPRTLAATGLLAAGLSCLCAVKPANGVALTAVLTVMAVAGLSFARGARRSYLVIAAVSAAVLAGNLLVSAALRLPGITETLQDACTHHFHRPDVGDPWQRLGDRDLALLTGKVTPQLLNHPFIGAMYVFAAAGLFRWLRPGAAWLVSLVGLTGVMVISMHPVTSETARLTVVTWIPVALGLAALVGSRPPRRTAPPRAPASSDEATVLGEAVTPSPASRGRRTRGRWARRPVRAPFRVT
jgi:hypothetical protein